MTAEEARRAAQQPYEQAEEAEQARRMEQCGQCTVEKEEGQECPLCAEDAEARARGEAGGKPQGDAGAGRGRRGGRVRPIPQQEAAKDEGGGGDAQRAPRQAEKKPRGETAGAIPPLEAGNVVGDGE
jgi:hypothetical protein